MAVSVSVLGVDKLQQDLRRLSDSGRVRRAVTVATGLVERDAKTLCPVDTGNLRGSIRMNVSEYGDEIIGKVSTNVEYAPYVEFGTGVRGQASGHPKASEKGISYGSRAGQTAQPYLYPALKQNSKLIRQLIKEAL